MTTKLICIDTWPICVANCLVMLRNGTATAMVSGRPEKLRFGACAEMSAPAAMATIT